ncbi:MAG: Xaa-Pro peptidase family protein [Halobacteriales archaeon]|nr:Xaa-Pro peptidase family protein [Halobacteriales archaeon]
MPSYGPLDDYLDREGLDGYLIDADGATADQRYLSGYDAPDPFRTLYTPETLALFVSGLEYGRAKHDSDGDAVRRPTDYGVESYADREADHDALAAFLDEFDAAAVGVPDRFPAGTADELRDRGVTVVPDEDGVVGQLRAVKSDDEIDAIRAAQRANEAALRAAENQLADATIDGDRLVHDGEALTAERVKATIERELLDHGYALDETIVAGGEQGADPHNRGSGPLPANAPIVIDVFPRSKATRYHADMTRTVVRGEASEDVRERFELTKEALDAALAAVEPGVTGEAVHDAVCDVYEAAGHPTLRSDPETVTGFFHSTGHGVGLEVHEGPRIGPGGGELEPGHVITIEPGLYEPDPGGMRLEDLVVVTEDGHENLTDYPYELEL